MQAMYAIDAAWRSVEAAADEMAAAPDETTAVADEVRCGSPAHTGWSAGRRCRAWPPEPARSCRQPDWVRPARASPVQPALLDPFRAGQRRSARGQSGTLSAVTESVSLLISSVTSPRGRTKASAPVVCSPGCSWPVPAPGRAPPRWPGRTGSRRRRTPGSRTVRSRPVRRCNDPDVDLEGRAGDGVGLPPVVIDDAQPSRTVPTGEIDRVLCRRDVGERAARVGTGVVTGR